MSINNPKKKIIRTSKARAASSPPPPPPAPREKVKARPVCSRCKELEAKLKEFQQKQAIPTASVAAVDWKKQQAQYDLSLFTLEMHNSLLETCLRCHLRLSPGERDDMVSQVLHRALDAQISLSDHPQAMGFWRIERQERLYPLILQRVVDLEVKDSEMAQSLWQTHSSSLLQEAREAPDREDTDEWLWHFWTGRVTELKTQMMQAQVLSRLQEPPPLVSSGWLSSLW